MGDTKIEWCDKVWNPITGCDPVSEGCRNCYAKRMASTRLRGRHGYRLDDPFRPTVHMDRINQPTHWKKPRVIFVCSMGDIFHKDIPSMLHAHIWETMRQCPRHTFLLLTKRPENIFSKIYGFNTLHNVWIGITAENQERLEERLDLLLRVPVAGHFISFEPLLGPINSHISEQMEELYGPDLRFVNKIDWVIVGGETGPGARPMNPEWARSIRDDCGYAGVPFFMKQMGRKRSIPEDLRIREFPW